VCVESIEGGEDLNKGREAVTSGRLELGSLDQLLRQPLPYTEFKRVIVKYKHLI
jgi:hypothetical protein